jgi:FtsH-binding integral membrane protein
MEENKDMVARMEALLAEKEKKETWVGTVAKNGGGAVAGGYVGTLAAPLVVGTIGAVLAPFTGGLSVAAAAAITGATVIGAGVIGHKMSKDVD